MFMQEQLRVYFIMGSNNCKDDPVHVLEEALKGGITMFQFREKGKNAKKGREKFALAKQMQERCKVYDVPFIVNDDVSLAVNIEADGVHVGQDDESVEVVKRKVPGNFIIGVSATNAQEAIKGFKDKADYIGAGPVFNTSTKEDAKTPIGLNGISEINEATGRTPIVAIGGINTANAAGIIEAGAAGVSVISALSKAGSVEKAAVELRLTVENTVR